MNLIKDIAKYRWISRWAGSYTYISCSFWGEQYTKKIKKILGIGFNHVMFIHKEGIVSFYVDESELNKLGTYLSKKVEKDNKIAIRFLSDLKKSTDIINPIMYDLQNKIPDEKEFRKFKTSFERHLAYHVFMKKSIEYLPIDTVKKLEKKYLDARRYSENVYSNSEKCLRNIMKRIAQKEKYDANHLTCLNRDEFLEYIGNKKLPSKKVLKNRFEKTALYFYNEKMRHCEEIATGSLVKIIEKRIYKGFSHNNQIKGATASAGRAVGKCRVILNPHKACKFELGDVLVTGMTRPEFMPYIKKASAIVTDVGGMLCHAAIVARELKIPCIVGTNIATKMLKDGDLVEVDSGSGTVKKIN